MFPRGQRRFTCRHTVVPIHLWKLWKRLYEDGRTLGLSLALTQAEVAEMLEALEEKDHRGLSPSDVAITPRDLAAPANVVSPVVPISGSASAKSRERHYF